MQPQYVPFFVFKHKHQHVGDSMSSVCNYCIYEKSRTWCDFSNLMIFFLASFDKYIICSHCVLMLIYFGQAGAQKKSESKTICNNNRNKNTGVFLNTGMKS